jgi:hypothetical protein
MMIIYARAGMVAAILNFYCYHFTRCIGRLSYPNLPGIAGIILSVVWQLMLMF